MTDLRTLAEDAVRQLDSLGAVILDDVGDGPVPAQLASAAASARDAVSRLAVPALTQLTGLVANVADSFAGGATEWNTSLGGTLMAAVDDLRHLAGRATQFSDEDSEHLANRAAELAVYVRAETGGRSAEVEVGATLIAPEPSVTASAGNVPASPSDEPLPLKAETVPEPAAASSAPAASASVSPAPTSSAAESPPPPSALRPPPSSDVVPIEKLFFSDAGPHIVSGGVPAGASDKSDLLSRGIAALEALTVKPMASQVTVGGIEIVPVETLLYRGRAALNRANEIREQIKASGGVASPATLDEMYDLIGLALKD